MEAADPLLLLVSLPLVPVGLVLGKMMKWQDPIIKVRATTDRLTDNKVKINDQYDDQHDQYEEV